MRLVHLSDLHLGFRQYQRQTPAGINQREADVAAAFKRAVDKVIELSPDLVAIAGDIFHTVRPTNPAILHAFAQFSRLTRELPDAPAGVPDSFSEHMKLMFDLQVLALQTDMTRVIAFKTGRDAQNRVFPESGSTQPFHPASHHGNTEARVLEFNKICKYRVSQMDYFLNRMKEATEGDSNLLDKTLIIWGSPMADPNVHNHRRCPLVLFGHANGQLKGGVHLKAEDGTPMANVMLTLMQNLGMDVKSFGDSTAPFSLA